MSNIVSMKPKKEAATFRLDPTLLARLKEAALKSAGKLSQAEIVESALADRFAVKDGIKKLNDVSEKQATMVTKMDALTERYGTFEGEVKAVVRNHKDQVKQALANLETVTRNALSGNTASIATMQQQMASATSTLRQIEQNIQRIERQVEQHAQARLDAWQMIAVGVMMGFSLLGVASVVWWLMRWSGRI